MATPESSLLHKLRYTKYHTQVAEENTWVLLSKSCSSFPTGDLPPRMDIMRSWLPFRPTSGRSSAWFLESSDSINVRECRTNYLNAWSMVRNLQHRSTHHPGTSPFHGRPTEVDIPQTLVWSKKILSLIRDSMVDAIGYLSWWEAITELRGYPKDLTSSIKKLNTGQYAKLGVVVDLESDWTGMNIPFWYEQDVPVYYLWQPEFTKFPRLALLNPRLLELPKQDARLAEAELSDVDITLYDEFLQKKVPLPDHTAVQGPYRDQIIDFEGWAPRDISRNMAKTFLGRFEHMTRREGDRAFRVFYRWRPIISVGFTMPT
jgi:hypothetical protein